MNAVQRILTSIFDVLLTPFDAMGDIAALVLVSGIFGVLGLLLFKRISWQAGIKGAKDRIKGYMIAIRIYQDDLFIVFSSVVRVVLRNFQYLGLNFGPILPILLPGALVAGQLVARYAFAPLPVMTPEEADRMLPGRCSMLEIRMKPGQESLVSDLAVQMPPGLMALTPLARSVRDGVAVLEFAATAPGESEIQLLVKGQPVATKAVVAGTEPARRMQPERVSSFWTSWIRPAEPTITADCPIAWIGFTYPDRDLGYLPGGEAGVLLTFVLASMAFGAALLKPLNIQI